MTTLVDALSIVCFRKLRQRLRVKLSLSRFLQLRFNLFLISMWPDSFTKAYVWILARLYFLYRRGQVKTIRKNVARAMNDRTPSEINRITRGVLKGMIQHYQEKMVNGFLAVPEVRKLLVSNVTFDGYERILQDALKQERGVIIATGHYGAVEFLPVYLAIKKYPTVAVAKFTTERLKEVAVSRANRVGLDVIVPGNGTNVLHEASKVLSQNKIFVIQCDETDEWHRDRNATMEFLGRMVHPDRMLKILCERTRAILLFGVLQREGGNGYRLLLHRVPCEGDVPINVGTLKLLEKYIYQHPEQWYEWKKYHRFACAS